MPAIAPDGTPFFARFEAKFEEVGASLTAVTVGVREVVVWLLVVAAVVVMVMVVVSEAETDGLDDEDREDTVKWDERVVVGLDTAT